MKRPAVALLCLLAACGAGHAPAPDRAAPKPPIAAVHPHDVVAPAGTRSDPYYWIRDDTRKSPEVLDYLRAENSYYDAMMAPTQEQQDALYQEIVARIQEDDSTVPFLDDGYWYYTRFETGKERPIVARRKGTMDAPEQIVLDANARAAGHDFYKLGAWAVSRDGARVAWAEDTVGRSQYELHVAELATGEVLPDTATNISPSIVWANDGKTFFYVAKDPVTLRESKVHRHVVGGEDMLIYDEADGAYYTSVSTTKSRRYVQIVLWSTVATEVRLLDADAPTTAPRVFLPRERDHEYEIDHLDGRFVIRSNWQAKNFRLMWVADGKEGDRAAWRDVIPTADDTFIDSFAVFRGFLAVEVRTGGLAQVRLIPSKGAPSQVTVDEPTYSMGLVDLPDPDAGAVRYEYESLSTPPTVYEQDVATGARTLLKRDAVLGGFQHDDYVEEYVHATARDGTQVPISVVHRKDTALDGTAPLLLYGYGSYGANMDPWFDSARMSLLDRGWVFAIAHIRGGEEMGRDWYDAGHLLRKMNTFTDFIDCTEYLVRQRYASAAQVYATGRSAGGLLMGAILNLRPDLYRGAIVGVPFVDVVTTMLDATIPLTTNEFDEWGNPEDKTYYDYMLSYSPYDNVSAQDYPSMLVTTSLWDSQVQYYEPAKWVARLRATKTDDNLLLLHVDMAAGHGGKSGRFERMHEVARDYAFLLTVHDRPDRRLDKRR